MIRNYTASDFEKLLVLWNRDGTRMGYAPLDAGALGQVLTGHPDFSSELAFLLEEDGDILGFISGCSGHHIPQGTVRGYITCLILKKEADTADNIRQLLSALEHAFRRLGLCQSLVSFFNPVRLPWVLPGTKGHQHNNMPGVPTDSFLYNEMGGFGYRESSLECAMYLNLRDYALPDRINRKASFMAEKDYRVERYDPNRHTGLKEMVDTFGNPLWSKEIPETAEAGMPLLVGLKADVCIGFAGPIYPEKTGRGYFSGIGVLSQHENQGVGSLLFYRLLEAEKAAGAQYMSLFTGKENPAKQIYLGAGFQIVRTFAVMIKELEDGNSMEPAWQ